MTPTTDLQKPFTDEQLREVMAPFPIKPLAGYANAEQDLHDAIRHQNLLSLIKEKRAEMAPDLAASVLELEAENKRLREGLIWIEDCCTITSASEYVNIIESCQAVAQRALRKGTS